MSITKKENNELPCYLSQKVINRSFVCFPSFSSYGFKGIFRLYKRYYVRI